MEPEWTKAIQSETVCNFYYFFFVVYAVITVAVLVSMIYTITSSTLAKGTFIPILLQTLIAGALAVTGLLFNYLVCSRALLSGGKA